MLKLKNKETSKHSLRRKINHFLISNHSSRSIRSFLKKRIFPVLFKIFLFLVIFLLMLFAAFKIFKPQYIDKIYHKSSFYFFHYLNLDNHEFGKINIVGNQRTEQEDIIKIVHDIKKNITIDKDGSYQPLIQKLVEELKNKLPWISQITITRSMPDILNINIMEYQPFAIWQNGLDKYITDRDGNIVAIEDMEEFEDLVILSGKNANKHAKSLFNIFSIDPNLSDNIYSATWIGNRRWDIRFENGLLIKLPEDNISEAWQSLIKIYNMPGSIVGLKIIDLRINNKIYLEYSDSVIKELKNI